MKRVNKYIIALAALTASMATFTGCQNDFDDNTPTFDEPVATLQANTTIAELKTAFWKTDLSYVDEIGTRDDGSHYIIKGRVTTSDKPGNVYKNIVIEDETAAITLSINRNALYLSYRIGQEVVIDVTGLHIGKYSGLIQLGYPQYSEKYSQWQCTFMTYETFSEHTELNGFPEPSKVQPTVIKDFASLPADLTSPEIAMYQSRLVRFNNVEFVMGGKEKYCDEKEVTTSREIRDANGQLMTVRTSGYANFYNHMLPEGRGDIVGILGFYQNDPNSNSSPWQITLVDEDGCMNFGNPTMLPGDQTNPYSVDQVTEIVRNGTKASGWVSGYIVGAVYGEVTDVTSNDQVQWEAPAEMDNTIVLAPTTDCKNIDECLIVQLPADSKLRTYANLRDNPDNYQKLMSVDGKFELYMGKCGVTGSRGTADSFTIDGVTVDGGAAAEGTGTKESPFNCTQIIKGTATGSSVWAVGYIVGWVDGKTLSDGARFDAAATVQTNLLIAATQGETDVNKCVPVQLPAGAVRTALNLQSHPENFGKQVKLLGSVERYFGTNGFKTVTDYELSGEGGGSTPTPTPGGSGSGTESDPWDIAKVFSLFNSNEVATGWIECYVVGYVPDKYYSDAVFGTADGASTTNIVVAATATETNSANAVPVQLPAGTVRDALNLSANPTVLGTKIMLLGTVEKYFGVCGIKAVTDYRLDGNQGGGGDTPTPPAADNLGTETAPLDVATFLTTYAAGNTGDSWVEGYIIGYVPGKVFDEAVLGSADGAVATNMLIADTEDCTDINKCLVIQLPSGDVRQDLNLADNPGNLKRKVLLNGEMAKYFGVAGLKSVKSYIWK